MSATVNRASPVTTQNADRQPAACPSQFATGTPITVATVRPSMTRETAQVRRSAGTRDAATSEAMPK